MICNVSPHFALSTRRAAPYVLRHALSHCLARITPSTAQPGPVERAGRDELHRMASLLGNLALLKGQYELGRGFTFCREARLLLSRLIDASGVPPSPHPPSMTQVNNIHSTA
jgi:hypothetical protein